MVFLDNLAASMYQRYKEEGLKQEEAAARCRITKQYFRRILKKKSTPSLTVFQNICIAFQMTPDEILQLDGEEFRALCQARQLDDDWKPIKKSRK